MSSPLPFVTHQTPIVMKKSLTLLLTLALGVTLSAPAALKGITAIRIEVLPDARLLGNGPGRNGDGAGRRRAPRPAR